MRDARLPSLARRKALTPLARNYGPCLFEIRLLSAWGPGSVCFWWLHQVREPHADIGCWWTLYDYGLDVVKTWPTDYVQIYPGALPHGSVHTLLPSKELRICHCTIVRPAMCPC